jgi:Holliday junction resolvase RusA-like endonuclease
VGHWFRGLPFPPSANDLWRPISRGRYASIVKTNAYNAYSKLINYSLLTLPDLIFKDPIAIYAYFYAPTLFWFTKSGDIRSRDLDNFLKGLDPVYKRLKIDDKIIFEIHTFKCLSTRQRLDLCITNNLTERHEII